MPIQLQSPTQGAVIRVIGQMQDSIPKGGKIEGAFFIEMPIQQLKGRKTPIELDIYSGGKKIDRVKTNFMGPN